MGIFFFCFWNTRTLWNANCLYISYKHNFLYALISLENVQHNGFFRVPRVQGTMHVITMGLNFSAVSEGGTRLFPQKELKLYDRKSKSPN